jgi:hypothetical protein
MPTQASGVIFHSGHDWKADGCDRKAALTKEYAFALSLCLGIVILSACILREGVVQGVENLFPDGGTKRIHSLAGGEHGETQNADGSDE